MTKSKPASRIVALEEAFLHPRVWEHYPESMRQRFRPIERALREVGPERLRRMDAAGIDLQVLSHVQPGVQMLTDTSLSIDLCRVVNDWLGDITRQYPDRFAGFAMLPTQSPPDAAAELERAVNQLGFCGALINGHTNGRYLDHPSFTVLLQAAEELDVPIYIHPTDPPSSVTAAYYDPYPSLVPGWGFLVESGTHLLRLMAGGVFDRHPKLKIIVGHMGELLPYTMPRLEQALTFGDWLIDAQTRRHGEARTGPSMQRNIAYYIKHNVFVTTSGVFDLPTFECARAYIPFDNLLFSVDDPMRDNLEAVEFLAKAHLSQPDREKLAHQNAERLLNLPSTSATGLHRPGIDLPTAIDSLRARTKTTIGRALVRSLTR